MKPPTDAPAPKLTAAQRKALSIAANNEGGLWVPIGSGQHQMALRLAKLRLGRMKPGSWCRVFYINDAGRAAIAGRKP